MTTMTPAQVLVYDRFFPQKLHERCYVSIWIRIDPITRMPLFAELRENVAVIQASQTSTAPTEKDLFYPQGKRRNHADLIDRAVSFLDQRIERLRSRRVFVDVLATWQSPSEQRVSLKTHPPRYRWEKKHKIWTEKREDDVSEEKEEQESRLL